MADRQRYVALMNRDHREYVENFRSGVIRIPGGKAIKMSRRDAVQFKGSYSGSVDGDPTRLKIKNLIILDLDKINPDLIVGEHAEQAAQPGGVYICHWDGKEFDSQEELDQYMKSLKGKNVSMDDLGNIVPATEEPVLKDKEDMVTCQFCGKIGLKGAKGLQAHMRVCPKLTADSPSNQAGAEAAKEMQNEEIVQV